MLSAALKALAANGISLVALDAAVAALEAPDANPEAATLLQLANSSEQIQQRLAQAGQLPSSNTQQANSVSASAAQPSLQDCLQDSSNGQHHATAHTQQHAWCDTTNPDQQQRARLEALSRVRRLLVQARLQPGPASLLGYPAAVEAAQQPLPFAPVLQLAQGSAASDDTAQAGIAAKDSAAASGSLLALLPPPQRAWLLADAAAAVLLPADYGR
jgi:hypothetical protein